MATYLVTGGCGFIGSNIVEYLLEKGETVRAFDNLSTGRLENIPEHHEKLTLIEGDILNLKLLTKACEGADFVLHQAALASVQRSIDDPQTTNQVNVEGTLNVLTAAKTAGVRRVVYAASSSAYGNQEVDACSEKLLPRPLSPYAVSKLAGEHYLTSFAECYGIETVALRYFNVFGPRQDPRSQYSAVIPLFISACLRGEAPVIYGDGLQSRDFTFVENNVMANIQAATVPGVSGISMNIACGEAFSLLQLLDEINSVLGTDIKPRFEPVRSGDVKHSRADISLAEEKLGYEVTVDFSEGLRRTVEWYRAEMQELLGAGKR